MGWHCAQQRLAAHACVCHWLRFCWLFPALSASWQLGMSGTESPPQLPLNQRPPLAPLPCPQTRSAWCLLTPTLRAAPPSLRAPAQSPTTGACAAQLQRGWDHSLGAALLRCRCHARLPHWHVEPLPPLVPLHSALICDACWSSKGLGFAHPKGRGFAHLTGLFPASPSTPCAQVWLRRGCGGPGERDQAGHQAGVRGGFDPVLLMAGHHHLPNQTSSWSARCAAVGVFLS